MARIRSAGQRGRNAGCGRRDKQRMERIAAADARGFWDLVQENRDDLKWCGSSPLYTFLKVRPARAARWTLRAVEYRRRERGQFRGHVLPLNCATFECDEKAINPNRQSSMAWFQDASFQDASWRRSRADGLPIIKPWRFPEDYPSKTLVTCQAFPGSKTQCPNNSDCPGSTLRGGRIF